MKSLAAIALLLTFSLSSLGSAKRALLVLVGDYPGNSGWNSLASHNDKEILKGMLQRNGFSEQETLCLEDEGATYGAIIAALEHLERVSGRGDLIYIHFSCHGQEITDIDGDEAERDPGDRYDEAVIPYDAAIAYGWNGYRGEHHLTDDVLNRHLTAIRKSVGPKGTILLVVDACHSGDIQRTETKIDEPYRGTFDHFVLPDGLRTYLPVSVPETWITLSACKYFQTNFEVEVEGVRYGRLSYAVSRVLRPGMTPQELLTQVQDVFRTLPIPPRKRQTPQLRAPEALMNKSIFR